MLQPVEKEKRTWQLLQKYYYKGPFIWTMLMTEGTWNSFQRSFTTTLIGKEVANICPTRRQLKLETEGRKLTDLIRKGMKISRNEW